MRKEGLKTVLAIPFVMMGIMFMFFSFGYFHIYSSPLTYEYGCLRGIHSLLISIGSFLLAILIRVW